MADEAIWSLWLQMDNDYDDTYEGIQRLKQLNKENDKL